MYELSTTQSQPQTAADVSRKTGANQTFVLQPITASLGQQSVDKGGNALGLTPSSSMTCKSTKAPKHQSRLHMAG